MALTPGTRIGPYEIAAQIGVGGMGEVYRATDTKLKREVAVKVLPSALAADPERLARFQREAEVLASLNHPNIAAIYGLEEADQTKALVMELVEGPTLADRITQSAIPVDEALPIAKQIAEALEAAHEQGIIHRDLKPANVKLRPDGVVKVLDFGLAKALEPTGAMSPGMSQAPTITTPAMTQAGMILGTAAYMSPEQAKGRTVDKRSDVWAFGAVLYEMLTGRRAFDAEDMSETLAAVLMREPDWAALPATTPPTVTTAIRRCLQKDRKQRARDIGDVSLALEGAFETTVIQVTESGAVAPPVWRQALPFASVTAVVAVLVTGLVGWTLWPATEPRPVNQFAYALPDDQGFRAPGNTVMALAPDGRSFVYNTLDGLYLRTMSELEARLIPGTEEVLAHPFFSPDGLSVAYWAPAANQLKRIAVSGGAPVVITEVSGNVFGANWASDGTILFGQTDGIYRVPATGGTPELVFSAEEGKAVYGPQLLPDGESVLFSETSGIGVGLWDEAQIVVQSLTTGERTVVWQGGSDARYVPTGHLVFALGNGLFGVAFDADSVSVMGGAVPLAQRVRRAGISGGADYGVSNDGTLMYLEGTGGLAAARTLALVDRGGQAEFLDVPPRRYLSPRLSPDGRRLAVQTDETDGSSQIWTYDLSGETAIQRLTLEGNNYRPTWTPDGQRIAFASDRGGTTSIYWQAADGSGLAERLTTAEEGTYHWPDSWSPDGNTLAFRLESSEGAPNTVLNEMDIWAVSLDGGRPADPEPIRATPQLQDLGAAFSPDGRWLAYASGASAGLQFEIFVEPFPPTGERRLVSRELGIMPLWSQNGRELFYRTVNQTGAAPQTLRKIDVTTDPSFTFTTEETVAIGTFMSTGYYRSFDVTPDGERFLVVLPAERTEVDTPQPRFIVVQNWFEELRRLVPTN